MRVVLHVLYEVILKTEIKLWSLRKVVEQKNNIDPKPQYQRGPVWGPKKDKLLIDSILRGIDIPKIYLRITSPESIYKYEVADGQQRLRAIWRFVENEYDLGECKINGKDLSNSEYKDLKKLGVRNFDDYEMTIAIVKDDTGSEIRTLFARLQMGEKLIPSELRNAIASNIGNAIDLEAKTNDFFLKSRIQNKRFKREDYLAHCLTLTYYKNNEDLKAPLIMKLYEDLANKDIRKLMNKAHNIFNNLYEINKHCRKTIKNKWGVVDFFNFLQEHYSSMNKMDLKGLGEAYLKFEQKRKRYNKKPEILLTSKDKNVKDKYLYNYIQAFNTSAGLKKNIQIRLEVFNHKFSKYLII